MAPATPERQAYSTCSASGGGWARTATIAATSTSPAPCEMSSTVSSASVRLLSPPRKSEVPQKALAASPSAMASNGSGLPLDAAAHRLRLRFVRILAGEQSVEGASQPGGVLRRIAVVRVRRAAVAQAPVGVEHEHVGRGLRVERPRRLLALVAQVGQRPAAVGLHPLLH